MFGWIDSARAATYQNARFSFDERSVEIVDVRSGYHQVRYAGERFDHGSSRAGRPELPVASRWFILPDHTRIDEVTITVAAWDTIPGRYVPQPVPESEESGVREADPGHYQREIYPSRAAFVAKDDYYRGFHLAQVLLYPVHYVSTRQALVVAAQVHVSISLRSTTAEEESWILRILRPEAVDSRTGSTRTYLAAKVVNADQFDDFYPTTRPRDRDRQAAQNFELGGQITPWPSPEGLPPNRVIIVNNQTLAGEPIGDIEYYANEYTNDLLTTVVTLQEIESNESYAAADVEESIQLFVRDAIAQWGTEFFLLAGDLDVIPTRRLGGGASQDDHPRLDPLADIYYVMNGLDWNEDDDAWIWQSDADVAGWGMPQASIGRLPIRDWEDAGAIFAKLEAYQSIQNHDLWYYTSALLAAGPLLNVDPNYATCGYKIAEDIGSTMASGWGGNFNIRKLYAVPFDHTETCDTTPYQCYKSLNDKLANEWLPDYEWEGDMLASLISDGFEYADGFHFVWHSERASWDRLGRASSNNTSGAPWPPADEPCGIPYVYDWKEACAEEFQIWAATNWDAIEPLTTRRAADLDNVNDYSIVLSPGAFTSAMDRGSIGEALLRNRFGGAIAYIGKQQNPSVTAFVDISQGLLTNIFYSGNEEPRIGTALTMGILEEFGGGTEDAARWGHLVPLLGDPGMRVWPDIPYVLDVTLPGAISALGPQTISVTVREEDASGAPVAKAVVVLEQEGLSYAHAVTDKSGVATFKGFAVLDTTDIWVRASSRTGFPVLDTLEVSSSTAGYLVYDSHKLWEPSPDADGDEVIEAGEAVDLHVVWRNNGTTTATAPVLSLWPSPSVVLDLDINGEFRPADTFIGSQNATPEADASDRFRIPLTWDGLSVHGEPGVSLTNEAFKVWAENATGRYVVAANSASASADTVFTGAVTCESGFANISMIGELGSDSYYASGDSIWFSFEGDASEDRLYFYANAPDWVTVTPPGPAFHPNVAPGDTLGTDFELSFTEEIPDRSVLFLTATAKHNGTLYAHSDFPLDVRAPALRVLMVEWEPGGTAGSDTTVVLRPTLLNAGSTTADSVRVTCRITGGTAWVPDSISAFGALDSMAVAVAADSIVIAAADSAALDNLTYEFEIATLLRRGRRTQNVMAAPGSGGGGGVDNAPTNLVATAEGRAVQLRWTPYQGTIGGEPVNHYVVYLRNQSTGADSLDFLGETGRSSFEVFQINGERLDPQDETGNPIEYRFAVRACSESYCGASSLLSTQRSWLPEFANWPKTISERITTAPLVVKLGSREAVFVGAGRSIYAWWLGSGEPLGFPCGVTPKEGLFFEASPLAPDSILSESNAVFAEALVTEQVGGYTVIFGNIINDCLYAIAIDSYGCGSLLWKRCFRAGKTAPTISPLESGGDPVVILPGRQDTLYAVMASDGTGFIQNQTPDGAFAVNETSFNLRSVAMLDLGDGAPRIAQAERGGRVVVWETPARNGGTLAAPRWAAQVETAHAGNDYSLSTPSTGNVDNDADPEIVVTDHSEDGGDGTLFVLHGDPADPTNAIEAQASSSSWVFLSESSNNPPYRPALACLDQSNQSEIVVSGAVRPSGSTEAHTYRSHVFVVDNGIDDNALCTAEVLSYRFGDTDAPAAAAGEPIVGDLNGDWEGDILMTTVHGDVAAWDYNGTDDCATHLGWPVHLGGEAHVPALAEQGIVIASGDGRVHYYWNPDGQLVSTAWPRYGYDRQNTGMRPPCLLNAMPLATLQASGMSLRAIPTPSRGSQEVVFQVSDGGALVDLAVFDVQGRRVRTLRNGPMAAGIHSLAWPGIDDAGRRLPSGIYFYQLKVDGKSVQRLRTLLLR